MNQIKQRLLHLHRSEQASWTTILRILKFDPTLNSLYQLTPMELHEKIKLPFEKVKKLYNDLQSITIASMLEQYKSQNIQCISIFDDLYPSLLKQISNPPWVLYAKGNIELLGHSRMVAVVGTRYPTYYGRTITNSLVQSLISYDFVTISGLAKGIDALVHHYTLQHSGKTIAILGSGFQHIYPKENQSLASIVMNDGLMLSEYPPNREPRKWQFPERNRIISGLSLGTVVVEAKEKSGSLITADLALEQNREVFAVPGPINSECSRGTNLLIQQGAKLVLNPEDIVTEFQMKIV
ncbi:DNA-processing protein DprA [Bacillus suaedaesalsae]|uniref:DNA-processing protein DprA n=1 Tax=Bacillus suaedaesalsae TaxID=2810349 RepID=A0ABS2DJ14_9BACI|nr:DNA-processing protein DprA [Bacillus suaedaesalsae]MBM6618458.1 DNA-processing protein DprA [Bacillus suaedaesalsae]